MIRATVIAYTLAAVLPALRADWRDDIGLTRLAAELGPATPRGTGIVLLQGEANNIESPPNYLPQSGGPGSFAGTGAFAGKTFFPESGAGTELGHATAVAGFFYGNYGGVASGATEIHNYTAIDFMTRVVSGAEPEIFPGQVQNHSWAGSFGSTSLDQDAIRAFDFMIQRDGVIVSAGVSPPGMLQPILGSTYNAITVGTVSGYHSTTGTTVDGAGRMKPDLVVNQIYSSHAAPCVGGAAACLLQDAIASGNANAVKPQTLKAILIATSAKDRLPQWKRASDTTPYDASFGAGELNIYHAWHVLHAGEQAYSTTTEAALQGWDFAAATTGAAGRRYFFTVPAGKAANDFSAALTWHRSITNIAGNYTSVVANLTLKLYAANGFTTGAVLTSSTSSVDNVEHLHLYHLPSGQYALEVTADLPLQDYALAWNVQPGDGPRLSAGTLSAGVLPLTASSLDPYASYTLESSTDLTNWTTKQTFRTADGTPSFQAALQDTSPSPGRQFYRLRWTPLR